MPEESVDRTGWLPKIHESAAVALIAQLGETRVPLELRPGASVPIPCRHCQKHLIKFTVSEGIHTLACRRCGEETEVQVYAETGTWRVKTSPVARQKPPVR